MDHCRIIIRIISRESVPWLKHTVAHVPRVKGAVWYVSKAARCFALPQLHSTNPVRIYEHRHRLLILDAIRVAVSRGNAELISYKNY